MNGKSCSGHKTGVIVAYAWKSTGDALVRGETRDRFLSTAEPVFGNGLSGVGIRRDPNRKFAQRARKFGPAFIGLGSFPQRP